MFRFAPLPALPTLPVAASDVSPVGLVDPERGLALRYVGRSPDGGRTAFLLQVHGQALAFDVRQESRREGEQSVCTYVLDAFGSTEADARLGLPRDTPESEEQEREWARYAIEGVLALRFHIPINPALTFLGRAAGREWALGDFGYGDADIEELRAAGRQVDSYSVANHWPPPFGPALAIGSTSASGASDGVRLVLRAIVYARATGTRASMREVVALDAKRGSIAFDTPWSVFAGNERWHRQRGESRRREWSPSPRVVAISHDFSSFTDAQVEQLKWAVVAEGTSQTVRTPGGTPDDVVVRAAVHLLRSASSIASAVSSLDRLLRDRPLPDTPEFQLKRVIDTVCEHVQQGDPFAAERALARFEQSPGIENLLVTRALAYSAFVLGVGPVAWLALGMTGVIGCNCWGCDPSR